MIKFDDITKDNIKEHNPNWPKIPDHSYRILIIGRSGSGKTNALFFNLISQEQDIDKIYLYAKDPNEAKYQLLMNKREGLELKHFNDSKLNPIVTKLFIRGRKVNVSVTSIMQSYFAIPQSLRSNSSILLLWKQRRTSANSF